MVAGAGRDADVFVTDDSSRAYGRNRFVIDLDALLNPECDVSPLPIERDALDFADGNSGDLNQIADFETGNVVEVGINRVAGRLEDFDLTQTYREIDESADSEQGEDANHELCGASGIHDQATASSAIS